MVLVGVVSWLSLLASTLISLVPLRRVFVVIKEVSIRADHGTTPFIHSLPLLGLPITAGAPPAAPG